MVGHLHSVDGDVGKHPDHLGPTTSTGGWSPALIRKYLTGPRADAYSRGLLFPSSSTKTRSGVPFVLMAPYVSPLAFVAQGVTTLFT